ncbi:MAG: EAL domain-containing protein [Rhodoferax sp.]|uniref:putative bifunctional diguanylate cyclase/phosphodiesterase n=1 Tax=Rhodoferax sp. TaxID=50421 RepID=UPI002622E9B9|nr:EAL domain-containing protein [Rhodoferax sp.]MDD2881462.1 EAL domain-containing protein [Rhodoferax sp.]
MSYTGIKRIHLTVWGVAVAFLLAIATAAGSLIWKQQQDALSNSTLQAERFVNGAVAALNRTLLGMDVLLASLEESLALNEQHLDTLDAPAASRVLRTIVGRNLALRRLMLLDERSHVLASSDLIEITALEIPPDFIARVLAPQVSNLIISQPVRQNSSAEQVLFLARHLKLADGSKVVALAEVLVMQFNTIMVQGADISGLEVTLERSDGHLLAGLPVQDQLLGTRLPAPMPKGYVNAQQRPARLTAQPAIVSAQSILYDSVLIAASIPLDAALTQWRAERNFILVVAATFAAMVLAAGGLSSWYLARMAQARKTIKQSKAEIEQLAFYDHLTNLPNRLLLMERINHALSNNQRNKSYGVLLFLDLDNFKSLNDTRGHDVGDLLLKQVARRLKSSVRAHDTVARLGGDEFVILLEDLSTQPLEAAELARRIVNNLLAALGQPYVFAGQTHKSSASVGATLFGADTGSASDLLKQADIAMYKVKDRGRNDLCFFDPKMQADISAHAALEADLQTAVLKRQFVLYYQPQVALATGVIGAEVLIRWQHPTRGMVPPFEFIPVAEESDLINQIGLWVLQTACQQLKVWQQYKATAGLQLAVNVSARQFRQHDFVALVQRVIATTGVAPQGLKLELTESLVLDNVDDTIAKMTALKALGVRFSMDDFGTGQSSLSYLTRLPLDQLKIDQSFVRNIGIKTSDGVIVQTIIGMAGNLGLEVIAEGVETTEQQAFLAEHGCTLYQGYLFGKPGPLANFEVLLNSPWPPA